MEVTVNVPEEFMRRFDILGDVLPQVLEIGMRELAARPQEGFSGFAEVLEFLAGLPTPEEILALRPSVVLQEQIDRLSARYQNRELTPQEHQLWKQYEYLEQVVSMAKVRASLRLNLSASM